MNSTEQSERHKQQNIEQAILLALKGIRLGSIGQVKDTGEYRQGDTGDTPVSYGTVRHARRSHRLVSPSDDREKVSPIVQPHCHSPHLQPDSHPGLSLPR
jgi:hypothetical protein